ncbi:hypothetical protein QUF50_05215 [Thiotrichales bacterium HSG1]|nr:hypothetical protein [Thiotrichales bacterium HSG1]
MKTRTIKTNSGKKYSGLTSKFVDRGEYIEYEKSFFTTERINKKSIIYESITSWFKLLANLIFVIMFVTLAAIMVVKTYNIYYDHNPELAKINKLIEQPSIDVLVEYASKNKQSKFIERVKKEIALRCSKVESELKHEQKNNGFIDQNLKDSYKISCPKVIEKF